MYPMNHFFEAADAFLAEGFVLGVEAVAFFGLGAFGFFVGGLAVFLAFGALLAAAALALAPDFLAAAAGFFFAAAAALFSFTETAAVAATEDLPFDGDEADAAAAFFPALPAAAPEEVEAAPPAPAPPFLLLLPPLDAAEAEADEALPFAALTELPPDAPPDPEPGFFEAEVFDSSLKDPEAPLPLVCIRVPDSTAFFRYFLMNGANFSASTLYWAAMYFLIACKDEPLRSLSSAIALFTISDVFGWLGLALGFLAPAEAPPLADVFGFLTGVAGAGVSVATAVSAIVDDYIIIVVVHAHTKHKRFQYYY